MTKLKRSIIKEELVALTGDFVKAVILNQLIYWSEKVRDFDQFIEEERERMLTEGTKPNMEKRNGWIYKSAEDLAEETMLNLTPKTMRKHIKELLDNGWIDERRNPNYQWDRTMQYRVNIAKIQQDLQQLGYSLEGYPLQIPCEANNDTTGNKVNTKGQKSKINREESPNQTGRKERAIPEITTEITTESIKKEDDNNRAPSGKIVTAFEGELGRLLSPMECQLISDIMQRYNHDLILEALKRAVAIRKVSIRYVEKILYSWEDRGLGSLKEVLDYEEREKEKNKPKATRDLYPDLTKYWEENGFVK